jgi:hypothetical protein
MPPLPLMPAMPWRIARYCTLAQRLTRAMVRDYLEANDDHFDNLRRKFFLIDVCPENKERFPIRRSTTATGRLGLRLTEVAGQSNRCRRIATKIRKINDLPQSSGAASIAVNERHNPCFERVASQSASQSSAIDGRVVGRRHLVKNTNGSDGLKNRAQARERHAPQIGLTWRSDTGKIFGDEKGRIPPEQRGDICRVSYRAPRGQETRN